MTGRPPDFNRKNRIRIASCHGLIAVTWEDVILRISLGCEFSYEFDRVTLALKRSIVNNCTIKTTSNSGLQST